jgi:uncharacterized protein YcbX
VTAVTLPGYYPHMPVVDSFNTTPVKSTALHHPDTVRLEPAGVVGDRVFLFLNGERRRFTGSAKAPLLTVGSVYDAGSDRLSFVFPNGSTVEGDASPVGDPFEVALYDRAVKVRLVDDGFADAATRWAGFELLLARVEPPEHAGGIDPVTVVSLASVADLGQRGGRSEPPDPRRFRMTIELDDCEPYEEDTWSGRLLGIGDAVIHMGEQVPRCVLTTLDPRTGQKDFPTLDVLATYRRRGKELPFGVYADVEQPGTVRVGDHVALLD